MAVIEAKWRTSHSQLEVITDERGRAFLRKEPCEPSARAFANLDVERAVAALSDTWSTGGVRVPALASDPLCRGGLAFEFIASNVSFDEKFCKVDDIRVVEQFLDVLGCVPQLPFSSTPPPRSIWPFEWGVETVPASLRRLAESIEAEGWRCGPGDGLVQAHGDAFLRNLLVEERTGDLVIVDWEWFGLYPAGFDLATAFVSARCDSRLIPALASLCGGVPEIQQSFLLSVRSVVGRELQSRFTPPPADVTSWLERCVGRLTAINPRDSFQAVLRSLEAPHPQGRIGNGG